MHREEREGPLLGVQLQTTDEYSPHYVLIYGMEEGTFFTPSGTRDIGWPLVRHDQTTPDVFEFMAPTRAGRRSRAKEEEHEEWRRGRNKAWRLDEERLKDGEKEEEQNKELGEEGKKAGMEARGG